MSLPDASLLAPRLVAVLDTARASGDAIGGGVLPMLAEAVDVSAWGGSLATLETVGRIVSCLFLFAFGACVGSFLNVVVYRIPAGLSVVTPPSRCPTCGGRLTWRENLPVIGWLMLRGSCRFCRQPISIQYPLIETAVGLLFVALYLLFFVASADSALGGLALPWWKAQGFAWSWPLFVAILVMVAGLLAATIVDARHYIIPGEITWTIAGAGFLAAIGQPFMPTSGRARMLPTPYELIAPTTIGVAIGGAIGLVISTVLLRLGVIPLSYADYEKYVKPDDDLSSYPFARRETWKELLFLAPTIVGAMVGGLVGGLVSGGLGEPHVGGAHLTVLNSLATAIFGFLIGGAILWTVRVLGTLGFGKEAMGLGDVHLLAAVGAVLGWKAATWTFVIALPVAIGYTIIALCLRPIVRLPVRELPLGPHLAVAAVIALLATPWLRTLDPMLSQGFANMWAAMQGKLGGG